MISLKTQRLSEKMVKAIFSTDVSKGGPVAKKCYEKFRLYFKDDVTDEEIEEKILTLLAMYVDGLSYTMSRSETIQ